MNDYLARMLTEDGSLRAIAVRTTVLAEECRRRHGTDPVATLALGRLVTGAALCGGLLKGEQRLALVVEGDGPLRRLMAETDAEGRVRASVKCPVSHLAATSADYTVSNAVGKSGFLHVVKDLGLKEAYRGSVRLQSGEIGEDLAYYFTVSEQTPSSVALGVCLGATGEVSAAGGFLVQALPDGDEGIVAAVERRLREFPPLTSLLKRDLTPEGILGEIFSDIPLRGRETLELSFHCGCRRQRIRGILLALGKEELRRLAEEENGAAVTCEFCREVYAFSREEVLRMAESLG
ncbi:MAG: Hsp33 family molecular chaperone HslO [Deltaproteobacteria bacterium]|nr:Hsp33 family molecular chaperone HslO [Deltaproteobacteria bacterium]